MPALNFAVETANLAKHDPDKFVEVWIVNELKQMMEGLRIIFASNDGNIKKFLELKNEKSIMSYNLVRNFHNGDKNEYKILPREKSIAFKAEKIIGTLHFLDNLKKLTELTDYVNTCIDEIISMNQKLIPEISQTIESVNKDIYHLQCALKDAQFNFDIAEKDINEIHKPRIQKLLEQMRKDNPHWHYSEFDAEQRYTRENSDFKKLMDQYYKHKREIDQLNEDIRLRSRLVKQLEESMARINKYLLAS